MILSVFVSLCAEGSVRTAALLAAASQREKLAMLKYRKTLTAQTSYKLIFGFSVSAPSTTIRAQNSPAAEFPF